ncbi:Ig-like domain-containing protein [Microbulbifer marinus]|uniref:Outer membrane protein assembly factor BamB, contains PQQ-like beta-propeller repeat n=1 Tax=Microbulbifer marinus TaxID=658218 RepID=A0A1H3YK22_9GAMM|nr:Ig-like domain-containing protein [Microbulbifer marinus]SEA11288.1 Outer membrane protein assembly factor BamB, contains PQQ-like beta-propeller repeat [Microbulbifer marinus]
MDRARPCIARYLMVCLLSCTAQTFAAVPKAEFDLYRMVAGDSYQANAAHGWLANDVDGDGDELSVTEVSRLPEHGELSWQSDGSFIYTPQPGFSGNDRIYYQLSDSNGERSKGLVVFHVTPSAKFLLGGDWSGAGNGSGHTSYQPGFLWDKSPELLWQYDGGSDESYYLPPAVADGQIFLSTAFWKPGEIPQRQYGLTSRSLRTGELLWQAPITSGEQITPPSSEAGHVFVQRRRDADNGEVVGIKVGEGSVHWASAYPQPYLKDADDLPPPTPAEDAVWVPGSFWRNYFGFDKKEGHEIFSYIFSTDELAFQLAPTLMNGRLYVGEGDLIKEYDASSRMPLRALELNRIGVGSAITANDIYASDGSLFVLGPAELIAIDAEKLQVRWRIPLDRPSALAVAHDLLYVVHERTVSMINALDGSVVSSIPDFNTGFDKPAMIVSDSSLIVAAYLAIHVFDRFSLEEEFFIDSQGPAIALADGVLVTANGDLRAYRVSDSGVSSAEKPEVVSVPEQLVMDMSENRVLNLREIFSHSSAGLNYVVELAYKNGLLTSSVEGDLLTLSASDFPGEQQVTVRAHLNGYSEQVQFDVLVQNPEVVIEIYDVNGGPVVPGDTVTGEIHGKVTVRNKRGQHAQFYKNFMVLHTHEHGHMVNEEVWLREFTLDTSEFFDGENLISVHVHPMSMPGERFTTNFDVGVFRLVTSNNNPAPNGDFKLPRAELMEGSLELNASTLFPGHAVSSGFRDFRVFDDIDEIYIDGNSFHGEAQVIAHLGASVLGRKHYFFDSYGGFPSPATDYRKMFESVHLVNFQQPQAINSKVVYFFSDGAGRANYGFHALEIPALPEEDLEAFSRQMPEVDFLNLQQGDHLFIGEEQFFRVQVRVKMAEKFSEIFHQVVIWVGNQPMYSAGVDPDWLSCNVPEGSDTYIAELLIPAVKVEQLAQARQKGVGTGAFAVWSELSPGTLGPSLPVREHVHLSSLRTSANAEDPDDYDRDGIVNDLDNCPYLSNSQQQDSNEDGQGDLCYGFPLEIFDDTQNGKRLVGGMSSGRHQRSLYVQVPDSEYEGTCADRNYSLWPPLEVSDESELAAIAADLNLDLGTIEATHGRLQVTLNGQPLHFYGTDFSIQDTIGQGVGRWKLAVLNEGLTEDEVGDVTADVGGATDDGGGATNNVGGATASGSTSGSERTSENSAKRSGGGSIDPATLLLILLAMALNFFRRYAR